MTVPSLKTHQMENMALGMSFIAVIARLVTGKGDQFDTFPDDWFCACCHRLMNEHSPSALVVCGRVLDEERFWSFVLEKPWKLLRSSVRVTGRMS